MSNDSNSVGIQPLATIQEHVTASRIAGKHSTAKNPKQSSNSSRRLILLQESTASCKEDRAPPSKNSMCTTSPLTATSCFTPDCGSTVSLHSIDSITSCCASPRKMESWLRKHAMKVHKMCKKAAGASVQARSKKTLPKAREPEKKPHESNGWNAGNCAASSEMRSKAYKICREFLSGSWKSISSNDMIFKTVGGGLSNLLYYCSLPETHTPLCGEPSQVLMRMYGQIHGDQDTTTITESIICTLLAERSLGPKLFGVFPGGRLEEYIPAQALMTEQIRQADISRSIARKLARLHALQAPLTKEPTWLFDNAEKWLEVRSAIVMSNIRKEVLPHAKFLMEFDYRREMSWLREVFKRAQSPIMFCHNDLQEGNILHMQSNGGSGDDGVLDENLVFIDFEYCAYNYRGFDIANHFCEWAYDYSYPDYPLYKESIDLYPNENQKRAFLEEYVAALKNTSVHRDIDPKVNTVEHLLQEAETFTLASHFFWSLWSLNSAHSSKINFGYWEYGAARLKRYLELKEQLKERFELGN